MLLDGEGFVLCSLLSQKKKEDRSRNVEYSNTIFSGENGEDGSVQPNNASMIKMLTLTMHTKFLYACLKDHHRMHVCVGLSPPPPSNYLYNISLSYFNFLLFYSSY